MKKWTKVAKNSIAVVQSGEKSKLKIILTYIPKVV